MNIRSCALAAAFAASLTAAAAQPAITFSGYGTVGAVHSSDERSDYLVDAFHPTGPGYTRAWSFDPDTRIAAQVNARLTQSISAVLQVISQQRYDGSYRPTIEWANVTYQPTPELALRAGRIVLPVFMLTDSRRVGYSNVWVRPPVEVYGLVPVTSNDGVDAAYRFAANDLSHGVQLTLGRSESRFRSSSASGSGKAEGRNLVVLAYSLERGPFTARLSLGGGRLTVDAFDPLFDAFRQFGPSGMAIADRYELDRRRVNFHGLGLSYDPGKWFITGEYAAFDTRSIIGARRAGYVSAGVRVGKVTPYAILAHVEATSNKSDPGLNLAGLPAVAQPTAAGLNAALNAQLASVGEQRTISLGVRLDLARNVALKLQYDRVNRGAGSAGTFGNLQPGFVPGGNVNLYNLAVDFVF